MGKSLAIGLCVFLPLSLIGQNLIITNRSTGEPIADVYVYHQNQEYTASTGLDGSVDIAKFPKQGIYIFQHPSYQKRQMIYLELVESEFQLSLKEKILQIDEITVMANRWEQDKSEVTQDILAINPKNMAFLNPVTSADLLEATGEVYLQKSQLGGGSPMLRGFSANSVLLIIDGVRLNNAIYRSGNLQNIINIDPNALEGSEIIFGPGSVMYGSDALGGVVDFHTREIQFTDSETTKTFGNTLGRYSSAANELTGHLDVGVFQKKWGYFGSFSFSKLGDLKAGNNRSSAYRGHFNRDHYAETDANGQDFLVRNEDKNLQVGSGFNFWSTIHKVRIKIGKYADVQYGFYLSTTSDIPRYDRLTEKIGESDSLIFSEWYYGPQFWVMHTLSTSYRRITPLFNEARLTLGHQRYEESRNDRRFGDNRLRTQKEQVNVISATLDLDKEFTRSSLYYGVDFFHNQVESVARRTNLMTNEKSPTGSRYPDGGSEYYTLAVYGNYIWRVTEKFTINLGGRLSDVRLQASTSDTSAIALLQNDIELNNQALNGTLGAAFHPSDATRWKVLFSSGFRAPNVDDVGKVFEVDNEVLVVPNADLKPEFSYNQELGYSQNLGPLDIDAVIYHSILTNAIVRGNFEIGDQSTTIFEGEEKQIRAQINASRARIFGGTLRLKASLNDSWAATSSMTYTEGYQTKTKEPLRHVPPVFGRTSLIYKIKRIKTEGYAMYNFTKPKSDIPDAEIVDKPHLYTNSGSPAWITLNLKANYYLSPLINVQAGIENILDIHYRTYSSGISASGRNFILSIRAGF